MKRTRLATAVLLVIATAVSGLGAASAHEQPEATSTAVLDWNAHAVAALVNAPTAATPGAGQAPQVSAQHLAMVQGAVYDAVNSIVRTHRPYLPGLPVAPATASQDAAVATWPRGLWSVFHRCDRPRLPEVANGI